MLGIGVQSLSDLASQPQPLAPQLTSPLKRKEISQIAEQAIVPTFKRRKLDMDSVEIVEQKDEETGYKPLLGKQADLIKNSFIFLSQTNEQQLVICDKIDQIIERDDLSAESKLIELGILYYYLASGKIIVLDKEPSLFTLRLQELEFQIAALMLSHETHCEKAFGELIPSGVNAYLFRTFVMTIFPHDGGVNLGGCYAIKALLNSQISLYLTEEMRTQVLNVIDGLLNDQEFLQLFLTPFELHDSMLQYIYLDLKMEISENIHFVHVRWCMLLSLFSLVGQAGEGNCFAISMTLNLLSTAKTDALKLMIEMLKTGCFTFQDKKIPIHPLVATRRKYDEDFKVEMTRRQAQELTPFAVAGAIFSPPPLSDEEEKLKKPLGDWMDLEFSDHATSAKEVFVSHKMSFLQQALLAVLQFSACNSIHKTRVTSRSKFLAAMMQHINGALTQHRDYLLISTITNVKKMQEEFLKYFVDQLYFVDYTHSQCHIVEDRVFFDFHSQGFKFNGNLEDYNPFLRTRRLFRLVGGELMPIDKLSEFVQFCQESLASLKIPEDALNIQKAHKFHREHVQSHTFRKALAEQLVAHNNKANFPWQRYDTDDVFFLIQRGGPSGVIEGLHAFKGPFPLVTSISGIDLTMFYDNLSLWLNKTNLNSERFLATYRGHGYNICPLFFESFWKSDDPIAELNKRVVVPGKGLGEKPLSYSQMHIALTGIYEPEKIEKFLANTVRGQPMTVHVYSAKVKEKLHAKQHREFDAMLTFALTMNNYKTIKEHLGEIFNNLGINVDFQVYQEIVSFMDASEKAQFLLSPFAAAKLLQQALIRCSKSMYIPERIIEQAICSCFDFPESVYLGNLNWVRKISEQLIYTYLTLTWDPLCNQLVLQHRWGNTVKTLSAAVTSSIRTTTKIYYS